MEELSAIETSTPLISEMYEFVKSIRSPSKVAQVNQISYLSLTSL